MWKLMNGKIVVVICLYRLSIVCLAKLSGFFSIFSRRKKERKLWIGSRSFYYSINMPIDMLNSWSMLYYDLSIVITYLCIQVGLFLESNSIL
nr:hypothetical protein CFP56_15605 [Quercus suber]